MSREAVTVGDCLGRRRQAEYRLPFEVPAVADAETLGCERAAGARSLEELVLIPCVEGSFVAFGVSVFG